MSEATQGAAVEQGQEQTTPAVTVDTTKAPVKQEQQQPEPQKQEQQEEESYDYEQTDDPKLNVVLNYLAANKLGADHPSVQAAIKGDFSLLRAELAARGAQGYEAIIDLGLEVFENDQKAAKEAESKIVNAVASELQRHGVSNEQWGEVIAWAKENADEGEVAELNKLLGSPLGAKAVTNYLIGLHREAAGVEYKPQERGVKEEAAPGAAPGAQRGTLSRAEFAAEAEKLHRKFGGNAYNTPEYKALARRLA